jgi:BirA family biotin operon repressor/biotin-[acetyl-CoA-carboxylase] ligase
MTMATAALPPGYRRVAFDCVGSTNDEARRLADSGAAEGVVVTAQQQSAGRGRHGKDWVSPPGNLYASILVRPACSAARASELVFAAGVAVCAAVASLLAPGAAPRCKWPNDVLVKGRKIAGILAEGATEASADGSGLCAHVVVGIGVNVAQHPPATAWPATSLASLGAVSASAEAVLERLVAEWDHWYRRWRGDGFAAIRAAWLERAFALGQTIELTQNGGARRGRFLGLDATGALLLETVVGTRETHRFGNISAAPGQTPPRTCSSS